MEPEFQVTGARSGAKTLRVLFPGGSQRWLHSSYDPVREAEEWADQAVAKWRQRAEVFIVFGLGLGYHIRALKDRVPSARILVMDPVCPMLAETTEILAGCEGVFVLRDCAREKVSSFLGTFITGTELVDVGVLTYQPSVQAFPQSYQPLISDVARAIGNIEVNMNTTLSFGRRWTANVLCNLAHLPAAAPVRALYHLFELRPGIIVAAGPSLDRNIHLLREAKDRAVIIAVGTSLKPVLNQGIQPDLVVTIDGGEPNYRHFAGLKGKVTVPLVIDPSVYPLIPLEHGGPLVMASVNPYVKRWFGGILGDLGGLQSGPSVANVAFSLATRMGCNPIILIGQDLAYPGGRSHAAGTAWEHIDPIKRANMLQVEDIYGELVWTDKALYSMLTWFESAISAMGPGRRVIDATEGGARIAGTEILPLREALDRFTGETFYPELAVRRAIEKDGKMTELQDRLTREWGTARSQLDAMEELLRQGLRLAGQLEDAYSRGLPRQGRLDSLNRRLDAVDAAIRQYETAAPLLEMCFAPVSLAIRNAFRHSEEENEIQRGRKVARLSQSLYKGLQESVRVVRHAMEENGTEGEARADA